MHMNEFLEELKKVLGAADVSIFEKLYLLDKSNGSSAGVSVRHYFGEILSAGVAARTRSIEYSQKTREAKRLVETQKRDAEQFKLSILQNPQVLSSAEALLTHAKNYNVPMQVVAEFLDKIGTIKVAQEQKAKSA